MAGKYFNPSYKYFQQSLRDSVHALLHFYTVTQTFECIPLHHNIAVGY